MKSKKSFQFIIGLTLVSLLLASCSDSFSLPGSLSIVLPASQRTARSALNGIDCSKDDAASYDITLVSEGDGTTRTLSAKPGDSVAVSNLLPGMWTVTAKALNSSNACIGYGTMQTEVKQGQSTEADLSLSLNSSSSITSFKIKSEPSTTSYNLGDTFTLAGLEFEIAFSNGYSMTLGKDNLSLSLSDAAGATVTDGQTAITAADTEITITAAFNNATFTFAIPLTITGTNSDSSGTSSTSIASFSALKTAIESVAASSARSFVIASDFTTATTDISTITVSGNITLTAPSGSTSTITHTTAQASLPLFTVSSTGSLTLGGSGGSLVIDGGGTSTTAVSATASLISVTSGKVTVGTCATLTNNVFSSSSTNYMGRAIYASEAASVTISGGTISNNDISATKNSSSYGGAVYMKGAGSFTMTSGTISGNSAYKLGGALYLSGSSSQQLTLTISDGTFSSNKAGIATSATSGDGGGAIYAYYTTLAISGSSTSFTDNSTDYAGGACYLSTGVTGTIADCTIDSNTAYTKAGGIYAAGNSSITTSCTISKNTVTAGLGGGMQIDDSSSVTMDSGSITGNTASTGGGGVYISSSSSSFTLKSGTISSNTYTLSTSGFGNNVYLNAGTYIYYSSGAATTVTTKTSYD